MSLKCPRLGCTGVVPDGANECPVCRLNIRPEDRELAARLAAASPPPPPGSWAWWVGGDGMKFIFQALAVLFLVVAMVVIVVLLFQSDNNRGKVADFTTTQGLIAGVLLTAITVAAIVAVMTVLFGSGAETLRDRTQMVRDVLAPLLAIFGTITGFYFGAKTVEDQGRGARTEQTAGGDAAGKKP